MKYQITIILAFIVCMLSVTTLNAQNEKTYLKGLTKATEAELGTKEIMLDGESIPVYNVEGKRIRGQEMMLALSSGKYMPAFYLNDKKDIKVIQLNVATAEEKKMMQQMIAGADDIGKKSDLIGKEAIAFSATDIHGKKYTLESLKGKIVVLNFWFVECKPCVMEIPELNELVKKYGSKNVVFLGLATNKKEKINSFLKTHKFNYNLIPSTRKIAGKYNVSGYPTHIIIDQNSKIAFSTTGYGPHTVDAIEKTIEELLHK